MHSLARHPLEQARARPDTPRDARPKVRRRFLQNVPNRPCLLTCSVETESGVFYSSGLVKGFGQTPPLSRACGTKSPYSKSI